MSSGEIDLDNTKVAFQHLTNSELRRNRFVFSVLKQKRITRVLTNCAVWSIRYKLPLNFLLRRTVFNVFCAGENPETATDTIQKLKLFKVNTVLDYIAEGEIAEASFDHNLEKILYNIELCSKVSPGQFIGVKPSSLTNLEKLKFLANNGLTFEEFSDSLEVKKLIARMKRICKFALDRKVYVYFDAEEYITQAYFDEIVEHLMIEYNKNDICVFNTIQLYLTDRPDYLNQLINRFKKANIKLGVKLVRGAYIDQEREWAKKNNSVSPIFPNKLETDQAYNEAIRICLENHKFVHTCLATHNSESIQLGIKLISEFNITDHYYKVFFSQLYGMSDHLTYNLANMNFNASKYVPYGELRKAIPYLIRRAEENSSVNDQSSREFELLNKECTRRKAHK